MQYTAKKAAKKLKNLSTEEILKIWPSRISSMGKEYCYCEEFYEQMHQIDWLKKNQKWLNKLEASPRVSYQTKQKMNLFSDLVYSALLIYKNGADNSDFDKDVKRLNIFIEDHIVFRGHMTFKRVNSFEMINKEYNSDGSLKTPKQKSEENVKIFKGMHKRFSNIIAKTNSLESTK